MLRKSIFVLAVFVLVSTVVYGENPDSFIISCTPFMNYQVAISTPDGGIVFGQKDFNQEFIASSSATIRNSGNVRADWTLIATKLNTWTLGTTKADNNINQAVLAAKFNTTKPASVDDYTDNDVVLTASERDAKTHFVGNQDGDDVVKNEEDNLWIYIKTPTDTTVDTAQTFRIDINAVLSTTY